jgi:hypothetical protein
MLSVHREAGLANESFMFGNLIGHGVVDPKKSELERALFQKSEVLVQLAGMKRIFAYSSQIELLL